jgi:hypothetical protein
MDSANAISVLWRDHRYPVGAVVAELEISADNGNVTLANIAADFETMEIEVIDTTPAAFEGVYTVSVATLADGVELLAAPILEGTGEIGQPLTGSVALWVYDPDAYLAAGREFIPARQWYRDGSPLPDQTGFTITPDLPGSYTLIETVEAPNGAVVTATSNVVTISGGLALTAESLDGRWIDLSGIVPDSRRLIVVALLDDAVAIPGVTQNLLANRDSGSLTNNWPFFVSLTANDGAPRCRFSDDGGTYSPTLATGLLLDATPRPAVVMTMANLDRFASDVAIRSSGISALASFEKNGQSTAVPPAAAVSLQTLMAVNRGTGPDFNQRMAPGTKLRFLWIAHDVPDTADNTISTMRNAVVDAMFSVSGTAPNIVFAPKALAPDGSIVIDGKTVTPVVFLAGQNFGQYEDGTGTRRLVNRGTGTDPILNGEWFA